MVKESLAVDVDGFFISFNIIVTDVPLTTDVTVTILEIVIVLVALLWAQLGDAAMFKLQVIVVTVLSYGWTWLG